jgi:DsbC/DsbD-like thiol-disulfide interchange protein
MIAVAQFVIAALLAGAPFAMGQDSLGQDNPLGAARANQQWVSVEELPPVTLAPGKMATATLRFEVSEGKHVNSSKPTSELLIPTKLTLEAPTGITVGKISYPPGQDLTFPFAPDEKLNVYTGAFPVTVQLRAAAGAAPGAQVLRGELLYQACNDRACFPPKRLHVEFEIKVQKAAGRDRTR